MLISAQNIGYIQSGNDILRNITLEVAQHDFITLVGPNGAGKSSLIKLLIGLDKPTSGSIHRESGLRMGYVPQRFHVPATLPITAQDFLLLCHPGEAKAIPTLAEEVKLEIPLTRPLNALSSGEMQRILLMRALLHKPQLLVLDEPAQQLDFQGQLKLYKLIERIYNEKQCSILMVSHDLHMVMASTTKVVCLYQHICCSGTAQAVTKDPEFIRLFGEDTARLLAVYHHEHDHDHTHEEHNHMAHNHGK